MMSLRALGNLSGGGAAAKLAATYYQEHSADYYVEDLDHQGVWMGRGSEDLGLEGAVDRKDFQLGLAGYVGGEEVQNAGKENRQMGWDLTFSAPKSVSIAWVGAKARHRQEIELAHQKAVETAFDYLEGHTTTRRGQGGAIHEYANLVAARFNHYTSRQGDPQLHSHVVVTNFSVRQDGTVGTLDSRNFYNHKMAAGALYQVELAWEMKKLGYEIEEGAKGTFRLKDVSIETEKLFSKRDQEIDKLAKEYGINSYAGTRGIVLATRPDKEKTSLVEREEAWGKEAREAGLDFNIEQKEGILKTSKTNHEILSQAGEKLTAQESTFEEKELLRETARASLGERSAEDVLKLIPTAQDKGYVIGLEEGILTTPSMLKIEQGIMDRVERMVKREQYGVDSSQAIERGIRGENGNFNFSEEQKNAIETATAESGIAVIQGRAGVGKSTMLSAVRETYEEAGYKVQGIALAGVAAQNLQKESGIESKTIASWLSRPALDEKTVVIIDEAGMVGSKQMGEILEKVYAREAKLILVGDERQLQPIAAGGILHAIDEKIIKIAPEYSSVVEDIKRQRDGWMKEVVKSAAQGHTNEAIEVLDQHKKICVYQDAAQARSELVDDYIDKNAQDYSKGIVITNRAYDAQTINEEIRSKLKEQGVVGEKGIEFDNGQRTIEIAKGDRVIFTRNDYDLDVRNGQRGMIERVHKDNTVDVTLDNGEKREVNLQEYNHLDYGWASTTYKAQGATVERATVFGYSKESMTSQQNTYVQISRAREETKLYVVAGERGLEREGLLEKLEKTERLEVLNEMKKSWGIDASKGTTLDHHVIKQTQERVMDYGLGM